MDKKEEEEKKEAKKNDESDYLDKIWENWSSRRQCEKTHVPKFIKKKQDNSRN